MATDAPLETGDDRGDPGAAPVDRSASATPVHEAGELRADARPALDTVVRVAGRLFDVPVAFLALPGEGGARIRAQVGIRPEQRGPLEGLAGLLLEGDAPSVVVHDAREDGKPAPASLRERLRELDFRSCAAQRVSADGDGPRGLLVLLSRDGKVLGPDAGETLEALGEWAARELALAGWAHGSIALVRRIEELRRYARRVVEASDARELYPSPPPPPATRAARGGSLGEVTPRQREVLALIARGNTSKEIAARLGISVKTVETHRRDLMNRLDIHDIAGLVRFAIAVGLVRAEV